MKKTALTFCAAVMAVTGVAEAPAAVFAPDAALIKLKSTASDVRQVGGRGGFYGGDGYYRRGFYRGRGYYRRGFYGGGGYYGHDYGLWVPGAAFIAGAIIGSALAGQWEPEYRPRYRVYRRPYPVYRRPYVVYRRPYVVYQRPYAVYDYPYRPCNAWRQDC